MTERCKECGRPLTKGRSNNQNRYYRGVVVKIISEHTGFTPEEVHELLKYRFLRTYETLSTKNGDKEFERTKSTTELTTSAFEIFMSDVRMWASIELGLYIPDPNEAEQYQT